MKKSLVFISIITALVIAVVVWTKNIEHNIFIPSGKSVSNQSNSINSKIQSGVPFNILLLGYGGGNHDGAYLTDSMIVVHIDPKLKQILLISIPRDIWINIPTNGINGQYWKINAAYTIGMDDSSYPSKQEQFKGADGGGHLAEYAVQQVTGLPINSFIGMDFSGFKKTIDTLGGVDINVETTFDDYQYPIDGKEDDLCGHPQSDLPMLEAEATHSAVEIVFPCRYEHLHFDKGLQHMSGEQALSYVRSRHSLQDGTDFGRSNRQRNLLVAVKQKVFNIGFLPEVVPFVSSLQDDLRTDMNPTDIQDLLSNANLLNTFTIINLAITNQNYLNDSFSNDGQAILLPKDGQDNWSEVHQWLTTYTDPNALIESPVIQIQNGTSIPGLAGLANNRLKDSDMKVLDPIDSPVKNVTKTTITIYRKNINQGVIDSLKKEFSLSEVSVETPNTLPPYDILITLGDDYNKLQGKKLLNE